MAAVNNERRQQFFDKSKKSLSECTQAWQEEAAIISGQIRCKAPIFLQRIFPLDNSLVH